MWQRLIAAEATESSALQPVSAPQAVFAEILVTDQVSDEDSGDDVQRGTLMRNGD